METAIFKAKGISSAWASASQESTHVGDAEVDVVSLEGAPLTLATIATAQCRGFFDQERAVRACCRLVLVGFCIWWFCMVSRVLIVMLQSIAMALAELTHHTTVRGQNDQGRGEGGGITRRSRRPSSGRTPSTRSTARSSLTSSTRACPSLEGRGLTVSLTSGRRSRSSGAPWSSSSTPRLICRLSMLLCRWWWRCPRLCRRKGGLEMLGFGWRRVFVEKKEKEEEKEASSRARCGVGQEFWSSRAVNCGGAAVAVLRPDMDARPCPTTGLVGGSRQCRRAVLSCSL